MDIIKKSNLVLGLILIALTLCSGWWYLRQDATHSAVVERCKISAGTLVWQELQLGSNGKLLVQDGNEVVLLNSELQESFRLVCDYSWSSQPLLLKDNDEIIVTDSRKGLTSRNSQGQAVLTKSAEPEYGWYESICKAVDGYRVLDSSNNLLSLTADGKIRWHFDSEFPGYRCVAGMEDNHVASNPEGNSVFDLYTYACNDILAVDGSGELLWRLDDDEGSFYLLNSGWVGDRVYVAYSDYDADSWLAAYDWDGNRLWQHHISGWSDRYRASCDTFGLRICTKEGLLILDPNGEELFRHEGSFIAAPVSMPNGSVFAISGERLKGECELQIISSNGDLLGKSRLTGQLKMQPALAANGLIYVVLNNRVVSINPMLLITAR